MIDLIEKGKNKRKLDTGLGNFYKKKFTAQAEKPSKNSESLKNQVKWKREII